MAHGDRSEHWKYVLLPCGDSRVNVGETVLPPLGERAVRALARGGDMQQSSDDWNDRCSLPRVFSCEGFDIDFPRLLKWKCERKWGFEFLTWSRIRRCYCITGCVSSTCCRSLSRCIVHSLGQLRKLATFFVVNRLVESWNCMP